MNLDPALYPPDRQEPEDNGEKILKWVSETFTPDQVFGEDVFEKPSLDFCKWAIVMRWEYLCEQWWHLIELSPLNDDELYQEYLKGKE